MKPKTKEELIRDIKQLLAQVTPEMRARHMRYIDRVVPLVICQERGSIWVLRVHLSLFLM